MKLPERLFQRTAIGLLYIAGFTVLVLTCLIWGPFYVAYQIGLNHER